jgi:ACS family glucarate transporter-like MFS transporter
VLLLIFAAAFITYLDRVCLSVAAPAMQKEFGLSDVQFGWVFTVFYIAYGIAELPVSWLGDIWGQRRMLIRIVGCWSVFTALTGAARTLPALLFTRTIFGAAEAGAFPTLSRALARWFPVKERARANGILWMGARGGGALAPPLAVVMIGWLGWRWTFAAFGAVGLVWCVICARWYRDDPDEHPAVNPAEIELIRSGAEPSVGPAKLRWTTFLTCPTMLALFASYFASGFGFQFFVTWLPTYLIREHGLSLRLSGVLSSFPLAAGAAGCILGGIFADIITRRTGSLVVGRRTVAVVGYTLGAIGYLTAVYVKSPAAAIAFLTLASGAHDLTLSVMWSTTTDVGGRFGGTAGGFINVGSSISGMLAPLTAATVASMFGSFHAVFWIAAALYFCAACLWLFIDPRKRLAV